MVLTSEYRVVLPMSVDEYQVAHLFTVAEQSKNETGGGEGVEILKNEPYVNKETGETGQYTYKKISKDSRVPAWIRMIAPEGSLDVFEESWNCYPDYKTTITNGYMKDAFHITITSKHEPYDGKFGNPHNIKDSAKVQRVLVDIANDPRGDEKSDPNPATFESKKTGRGKLGSDWITDGLQTLETSPMMCSYKLVEVEFKCMLLQSKIEGLIQSKSQQIVTYFTRQLFCWMDKWYGLSIEDIRKLEAETKAQLDAMYTEGALRGMSLEDEKSEKTKS